MSWLPGPRWLTSDAPATLPTSPGMLGKGFLCNRCMTLALVALHESRRVEVGTPGWRAAPWDQAAWEANRRAELTAQPIVQVVSPFGD